MEEYQRALRREKRLRRRRLASYKKQQREDRIKYATYLAQETKQQSELETYRRIERQRLSEAIRMEEEREAQLQPARDAAMRDYVQYIQSTENEFDVILRLLISP